VHQRAAEADFLLHAARELAAGTSTELRNVESRGSSPQRPKRGMRSKSFAVSWFLSHWIGKQNGSLVVFEATGAYYRCPEAALAANGTPFTNVNPRQARRFAEASGRLAKTDRVDAIMLAKMGAILGLKADRPKSEVLYLRRELLTARRALMKVAAKARLQTTRQTLLKKRSIARSAKGSGRSGMPMRPY
jgi:transposase